MDITRPSTLPCFPSFKFHVFVKNSDLIVIHPEAELYKVSECAAPDDTDSGGRFLFLVSRHVNSTLDSKHGCQGGSSQRQITFMGG